MFIYIIIICYIYLLFIHYLLIKKYFYLYIYMCIKKKIIDLIYIYFSKQNLNSYICLYINICTDGKYNKQMN